MLFLDTFGFAAVGDSIFNERLLDPAMEILWLLLIIKDLLLVCLGPTTLKVTYQNPGMGFLTLKIEPEAFRIDSFILFLLKSFSKIPVRANKSFLLKIQIFLTYF